MLTSFRLTDHASIIQWVAILSMALVFHRLFTRLQKILQRKAQQKRDVESPPSPEVKAVLPSHRDEPKKHPYDDSIVRSDLQDETNEYKQMYHKLQNLEHYIDVLPTAKEMLIRLFSETITEAQYNPTTSILSISEFDKHTLSSFIKKDYDVTNNGWEEYIQRRKNGSPREMFSNAEEAIWWLKNAAPVKYVDGAWLGHINKITTPFALRPITKNSWQVMSEELGDGDLAKNHVYVYEELMKKIGADLPPAYDKDFIHPKHDLNEPRVWKAAIAQLLISLFPNEFLPECLGFNMAYEGLPLHLMKTTKELEELQLDNYYFVLHISIDNGDSGHAAMAMQVVSDYMDYIRNTEGPEAASKAWRRIQAGFILSEGLPTTPEPPSLKVQPPVPKNEVEAAVIKIFEAKAPVAHKIHCSSRMKIGSRSLVDWLDPTHFADANWQREFLDQLSTMKPWVYKGDSAKSKLIKDMSWEGKMFGAFTDLEVEAVRKWIDSMGKHDKGAYYAFTGQSPVSSDCKQDTFSGSAVRSDPYDSLCFPSPIQESDVTTQSLNVSHIKLNEVIRLWFSHPALLQNFIATPARVSNEVGSATVRLLRAQSGFTEEGPGVAGMDELKRRSIGLVEFGLEMMARAGLSLPSSISEVMIGRDREARDFAETILRISWRPEGMKGVLYGLSWVFMQLHEIVAEGDYLCWDSRTLLKRIAQRERDALMVCFEILREDPKVWADINRGYYAGKSVLERLC